MALLLGFYGMSPKGSDEKLQEYPAVKTLNYALVRVTARCRRHNQNRFAQLARTQREADLKAQSPVPCVRAATQPANPTPQPADSTITTPTYTVSKNAMAAMDQKFRGRGEAQTARIKPSTVRP